jgi:hypothetical protein
MVNRSMVVVFDDERAALYAGVMLPALPAGRLGSEALVEESVDLGDRPRRSARARAVRREGRQVAIASGAEVWVR